MGIVWIWIICASKFWEGYACMCICMCVIFYVCLLVYTHIFTTHMCTYNTYIYVCVCVQRSIWMQNGCFVRCNWQCNDYPNAIILQALKGLAIHISSLHHYLIMNWEFVHSWLGLQKNTMTRYKYSRLLFYTFIHTWYRYKINHKVGIHACIINCRQLFTYIHHPFIYISYTAS